MEGKGKRAQAVGMTAAWEDCQVKAFQKCRGASQGADWGWSCCIKSCHTDGSWTWASSPKCTFCIWKPVWRKNGEAPNPRCFMYMYMYMYIYIYIYVCMYIYVCGWGTCPFMAKHFHLPVFLQVLNKVQVPHNCTLLLIDLFGFECHGQ